MMKCSFAFIVQDVKSQVFKRHVAPNVATFDFDFEGMASVIPVGAKITGVAQYCTQLLINDSC